jgi:excinuclease ABC subunit C
VGKAKNLKKRVSSYFVNRKNLGAKTQVLVSQIKKIRYINVDSELESLLLEANLIKKFDPRYNARLTDGKSYLRAKITIKDEIPKVLFARREDEKNSIYFGPFPNSTDLKTVLKIVRRIFPYQSVNNHPKRYCLYYHLGLCPCPPMFKNSDQVKDYRKNIRYIVKFLEGNTKDVIRELEEEREALSKEENFEEASSVQKKIDAINYVTSQSHNPFEYEQNPNLRSDLRSNEISGLIKALNQNGYNLTKLERIECYDISNISGIHATGSMVVFTNGEKDSGNYRRFQIKRPPKVVPNDFAMMREVITRRFNHPEWGKPDLLIIDGGKGQVSSVKQALFETNIDVAFVGIAKKEELLITPEFKVIRLSKKSPALNLVRRVRDEAHRFAITYHKKLRAKYLLPG